MTSTLPGSRFASLLSVRQPAVQARRAGRVLGTLPTSQKNAALSGVALQLRATAGYGHHPGTVSARDERQAERFVQNVDSAAVIVNVSTRFKDGALLALGAAAAMSIQAGSTQAVSNQQLHARGPRAFAKPTTLKWVVRGEGQIRI